jgi:hypothetical protein
MASNKSKNVYLPQNMIIISKRAPAKTTEVFDTFWRFACERQQIFFARIEGTPPPWTNDSILREYKFTNAYRASDRVSQYLIKNVIYEGDQAPEELFFRTILFKLFNKIETWELFKREFGNITASEFSASRYASVLNREMAKGGRVYSSAYIMPTGGRASNFARKHDMHLSLLKEMMDDELPARIADVKSMDRAFELLRRYKTIGDFLAYQFVTDLNYSILTNFAEMDFVIPGPGARDGIRKCFSDLGGLTEAEIIKITAERQEMEFRRLGVEFRSLYGRPLQLIDCQNLFCEVDKYARVKHPQYKGITERTRIKQKYRMDQQPISYWYPPKWGINNLVG